MAGRSIAEQVATRINKELDSICDNGFAVMYYITSELVRQSNADGYIVGSRGSVGSSLVATLCGITEVNPYRRIMFVRNATILNLTKAARTVPVMIYQPEIVRIVIPF